MICLHYYSHFRDKGAAEHQEYGTESCWSPLFLYSPRTLLCTFRSSILGSWDILPLIWNQNAQLLFPLYKDDIRTDRFLARWWTRKMHISFSIRNTDLMTIYNPKSLYKNTRSKLRSRSTMGRCITTLKCTVLYFTTIVSSTRSWLNTIRREHPSHSFSLG